MYYDIIPHLARQVAFSRATFGPGPRTKGVTDHIRKELVEVEAVYEAHDKLTTDPYDWSTHTTAALEWTDVAILALDGLLRSIWAANPNWSSEQVAEEAVAHLRQKQGKNERREWPDWRTAAPGKAIEHVRGIED